ncbi:anhydro-N-acetylmuramic acid kinase AnmK [Terrilactibacillus laevilacticus]|uniref:Anhydro-N-acetylmuramic acid kinase n=1 Tax=Terrilactibacillus laevilacticus TaxID=1380157 RepID=A0ABW5PMQ6_9BACI|nr:anhydro-N-acetylmuramic acid kinase AnmK [Terrilactibacillus laevilacticus]
MNNSNFIIGLMTGTSVDGVDAALVNICGYGKGSKIKLIHSKTFDFPDEIKNEIFLAMDIEKSNVELICSLNYKLGQLFANCVQKLCHEASVKVSDLTAIGSHGQTIYHIPNPLASNMSSTLQLGEPAIIAYETNTTVISNFRAMDMAAGGVGAPLVPYTDYILYGNNQFGRTLQNIGGIGNVTVLPKNCELEDVFAFDTGPGNMIIDSLCNKLLNESFDKDGKYGSKGKVQKHIVDTWMKMDYFMKTPPKATGRELFGEHFVEQELKKYPGISSEDWIATATYFTAKSIAHAYLNYVFPNVEIDEIIIGGGGSYNPTLIQMLKNLLPNYTIKTQEDIGFSSSSKEAIAFAILANETLHRKPSNVPKATGAKQHVVLGQFTYPPFADYEL